MSIDSRTNPRRFSRELIEPLWAGGAGRARSDPFSGTELEGQPDLERYAQLVDVIVRGITSLGGSAATINLPDVEWTTFCAASLIDTIKDRTTVTAQDFQYGT